MEQNEPFWLAKRGVLRAKVARILRLMQVFWVKIWLRKAKFLVGLSRSRACSLVLLRAAYIFPVVPYDGEHPADELELDGVEHRALVLALRDFPAEVLRHLAVVCHRRERRLRYGRLDVGHGQLGNLRPPHDGRAGCVRERRHADVAGVLPWVVECLEVVGGDDGGDGVDRPDALYAGQQGVACHDLRVGLDGLVHLLLDPVYERLQYARQLQRPADLPPLFLVGLVVGGEGLVRRQRPHQARPLGGKGLEPAHGIPGEP